MTADTTRTEEHGAALPVPVVTPHVKMLRIPLPTRGFALVGDMGRVAAAYLPPRDRLMFYGGLAAAAAIGVLDWPVAAAVGVGTMVARRAVGRRETARPVPASTQAAAPAAPTARTARTTGTSRTTAGTTRATTGTTRSRTAAGTTGRTRATAAAGGAKTATGTSRSRTTAGTTRSRTAGATAAQSAAGTEAGATGAAGTAATPRATGRSTTAENA
ncbi:hypothetical protein GCM10010151_20230 [Actinoallomurus spadix]|uniref:Uncharacterized protein n=1 Tax=Actinoallomurus spadix TaxID=79912 RepID=A0ABN0WA49_9ACTN